MKVKLFNAALLVPFVACLFVLPVLSEDQSVISGMREAAYKDALAIDKQTKEFIILADRASQLDREKLNSIGYENMPNCAAIIDDAVRHMYLAQLQMRLISNLLGKPMNCGESYKTIRGRKHTSKLPTTEI
jgi:hypothetical protein